MAAHQSKQLWIWLLLCPLRHMDQSVMIESRSLYCAWPRYKEPQAPYFSPSSSPLLLLCLWSVYRLLPPAVPDVSALPASTSGVPLEVSVSEPGPERTVGAHLGPDGPKWHRLRLSQKGGYAYIWNTDPNVSNRTPSPGLSLGSNWSGRVHRPGRDSAGCGWRERPSPAAGAVLVEGSQGYGPSQDSSSSHDPPLRDPGSL